MDAIAHHHIACVFVERRHQAHRKLHRLLVTEVGLHRGSQHTDTDGLGQNHHVARPRAAVRQDAVGVDEARHGEAILRLVVEDAVSAGDDRARLIGLVVPAAENLVDRGLFHLLRHAHDVERELRLAAHRVDVRERIRRSDLAESVGIIRDRREEVHRLHERELVRHAVDRRVVALVEAHQQIRVAVDADALEQLRQRPGADLRAAPGALRELRQLHLIFHHASLLNIPDRCRIASKTPPPTARALSDAV